MKPIPKNKPERNKRYLQWVRERGCCICGGEANAHHIIGHGRSGMGTRASDYEAIPLCHYHHQGKAGLHELGWREWERVFGSQLVFLRHTVEAARREGWVK